MKKWIAVLLALTLSFSCLACGEAPEKNEAPAPVVTEAPAPAVTEAPEATSAPEETAEPASTPREVAESDVPEALLEKMTLREKVGQLFVIRMEALDVTRPLEEVSDYHDEFGATEFTPEMEAYLAEYPAGGIALFSKNLTTPEALKDLTAKLHSVGNIPLLLCIDEEGGMVARLANEEGFDLPQFPDAEEMAAEGDASLVREEAATIGGYLSSFGIDVDFAPVADVNSNPDNVVIGSRAYSNDPAVVSEMIRAYLDGLHSQGILGCIKHYPGHGDTDTDSHTGAVVVNKTWEELLQCEIIPFQAALDDTDMIMAAHIQFPAITGNDTPASLCHIMLWDNLRKGLGYEGVIITDALAMDAITLYWGSGEAAVRAVRAGVDIVLMPWDYTEAFEAVLAAVENGDISEDRLNDSVLRILHLKQAAGLL